MTCCNFYHKNALDKDDLEQQCFFLNGPGGSGKTYLYNTLMSFVRGNQKKNLYEIASSILKVGCTVHRCFKLPVPVTDTRVSKISLNFI